ncbi:negative effector of the concentration of HemA [Fictibacillus macauensis ZFHKF-1]|uniref:Negative effector of the concentration of HemA n=1 Tax=Fictibacillus macauensis ZFHKF-1 TaxID=1196324 RepID=I8AIQ5_9BACL|nr:cytochrome c biogenesis protein [Fictibacillus macauensis]EIT85359.1 negative effector of the concentration of HemA [Fictibacillus macauensis ZFHKF-1]
MQMQNANWIYDTTIILYALSIIGYFIDFLQNNRKANRMAFWLLSFVWILQSMFFFQRMIVTGRPPLLTPFEGLFFYAWVLVTFSLLLNWFFKIDFLVFFTNVVGFFIMSFNLFAPGEDTASSVSMSLISELLVIHVTMAFVSYGAFTLSFIFSMMYLLQYRLLKQKKWSKRLQRLGSLSVLEQLSFVLNMTGVPLLLLSLILGIIWAYIKVQAFSFLDVKVISSFIVLIVYSNFLYQKVAKGLQGKQMVFWNSAAFLVVLINFFLASTFTTFHFWYD